MRRRRARATRRAPSECTGFALLAGPGDLTPEQAARRAAAVVRETLGPTWRVVRLGQTQQVHVVRRRGGAVTAARAWDLVGALRAHRDVQDAEPLLRVPGSIPQPMVVPRGPRRGLFDDGDALSCAARDCEWSVKLANVVGAWDVPLPPHGEGKSHGEGVVVGHPDTGYTPHQEIFDPARLLVAQGRDFTDDTADPTDPLEGMSAGHGTSTASVIMSGTGPVVVGAPFVTGAAPRASLVPLRVTSNVMLFEYGTLERALYYAADQGHHVVSISLGGAWGTRSLRRAVRYAVERGVIVLAAAGNYWPWVVYPACYDEAIAVAACNCERDIWDHSSTGPEVDVTAPGESVWRARSTDDGFDVAMSSGTSYAVATLAGACALWLAFHGRARLIREYGRPHLASVFKEVLTRHGVRTPAGWDETEHGAGILDAVKLLEAPLPATPPARGLRTLRVRTDVSVAPDLDRIARHVPDADRGRLRSALEEMLGSRGREFETDLIEFADELSYHVAVDPAVRTALAQGAAVTPRARARRAVRRPPALVRNASRALRRRLVARR